MPLLSKPGVIVPSGSLAPSSPPPPSTPTPPPPVVIPPVPAGPISKSKSPVNGSPTIVLGIPADTRGPICGNSTSSNRGANVPGTVEFIGVKSPGPTTPPGGVKGGSPGRYIRRIWLPWRNAVIVKAWGNST